MLRDGVSHREMKIDGKKQTNKENHRETEIENGRLGRSRETGRDGKRRREIRGETGGDTETLEKSQSDREKQQEMEKDEKSRRYPKKHERDSERWRGMRREVLREIG